MKYTLYFELFGNVNLVHALQKKVPVVLPGRPGTWIIESHSAEDDIVDATPADEEARAYSVAHAKMLEA